MPQALHDWLPWLLFFGMGMWGGLVQYFQRWRRQQRPFSLLELFGDLVTSGFICILVALGIRQSGVNDAVAGIIGGMAGHMGTRSLFLFERWSLLRMGLKEEEVAQLVEPPSGLSFGPKAKSGSKPETGE